MTKRILSAVFAVTVGVIPAFAGEGGGNPFPFSAGNIQTRVLASDVSNRDTGAAAYPDVRGLPGSNLPQLAVNVLPSNGSEGEVQTANSLPQHFEEGTVSYAQAVRVQAWVTAHARAQTPGYAAVTHAQPAGG